MTGQQIFNFLLSIFFAFLLGDQLNTLITGRMFLPGHRFAFQSNFYLWGDRSVRPNYLVGLRARLVSFFLLLFLSLVIVMLWQSNLIQSNNLINRDYIYTNLAALILGILISTIRFNYQKKRYVAPEDSISIYTK